VIIVLWRVFFLPISLNFNNIKLKVQDKGEKLCPEQFIG
jgi:hypothetical protein